MTLKYQQVNRLQTKLLTVYEASKLTEMDVGTDPQHPKKVN